MLKEGNKLSDNSTKQKVVDAASALFFQKGFHGTSVRDIADKASVNVSLISYYFKSKQGLLEYAVMTYYEQFFECIETALTKINEQSSLEKLKKLTEVIIQYRQERYQLALFIQRELSLDSIFVREVSVTYLAKEQHIISTLFFDILKQDENLYKKRSFLLMQFQGMLIAPYTIQSDWNNQLSDEFSHRYFAKNYVGAIHDWLLYLHNKSSETTN